MVMNRVISIGGRLLWCALLFIATTSPANDLYVATNGSPAGDGTPARPYDLTTALSGAAGNPGDVFWLRGGTYALGHLDTKIQGAPGLPITFRPLPGERARINGSLSFFDRAG